MSNKAPLNDTIIAVVSRMVDDAKTASREPSHSDLEFQITRSGLCQGDPKAQGQVVGKAKRVRATLSWALEHEPVKGEVLVGSLVSLLRGCGGFRSSSPNFIGADVICDASTAFREVGFVLSSDGELRPALLDGLAGRELTAALRRYAERAQRAADVDAALVVGTGKDLLEATAAHVLSEKWGAYPTTNNFPTMLGQAFVALGLQTPKDSTAGAGSESHTRRLECALYEASCAINTLRNKEGTGHGRPWLPNVTEEEAKRAAQVMGVVAGLLLDKLEGK